ncbi:hypothetical protein CDD82_4689 [Ophiocordyceps australis]|uniref:DUF7514 domain-containing protein n=1 Tax=Ophiocordyceps australis TaxID=1399860 RepID=A0A2C5ZP22_9HYPO|nr:hypothetical protein CDD82_4689 [Ophiocordyceps australis]
MLDWIRRSRMDKLDSSSCESSDASELSTPSDCAPSTPGSECSDPLDWIPKGAGTTKPFQATVEDDDDDDDEENDEDDQPSSRDSCVESDIASSKPSRRRPMPSESPKHAGKSAPSSASSSRASGGQPPVLNRASSYPGARGSTPPVPSSRARPTVHFSDREMPKLGRRGVAGSELAAKTGSSTELSVVDLQWGRLFTGGGEPTMRLRQVLRGLAKYITGQYETCSAGVITPRQLLTFYKQCQVDKEIYPFEHVFETESRKALRCLELLYLELGCEYYLIQDCSRDRPYIPAMTLEGFASWMAVFMQASPGLEARRLDMIMSALPVEVEGNTLDGKPERLPKQLSRHLFPGKPQERSCQRVVSALRDWLEATGLTEMRPVAPWVKVMCEAVGRSRSLSPTPRYRGRNDGDDRGKEASPGQDDGDNEGGRRHKRRDRETYIEVIEIPASDAAPKSRSSRPSACSRRSLDQIDESRFVGKALAECSREVPLREHRSTSTSSHRYRTAAQPRDDKTRHSEHRYSEPRASHRSSAASGYSSSSSSHHRRRRGAADGKATPPSSRECSPRASRRSENYALYQGRDAAPPGFDDHRREKSVVGRRSHRGTRYGG